MSHYSTLKGLGRAVAYYPAIGIKLGNPLAGIMLCQLIYWNDKTDNELGVYKTAEEWTAETGLTYSQQRTARKLLRSLGILLETEKRLEHKIFFKLDISAFDTWYQNDVLNGETRELQIEHSRNEDLAFGDKQNVSSGASNHQSVIHKITSENTTESTSEKKQIKNTKFDATHVDLPANVNRNTWIAFVEMRSAIKKPLTENAVELALKKLEQFGHQANESLENSILNNYSGLFLPKTNTSSQPKQQQNQSYQRRFGNSAHQTQEMRDVTGEQA